MAIWRIPKATNTHSGCVILIVLSLQQWLRERGLILLRSCTYIVCLLCLSGNFLLLHLLRTLARFPILLGKMSKIRYSSTKFIFFFFFVIQPPVLFLCHRYETYVSVWLKAIMKHSSDVSSCWSRNISLGIFHMNQFQKNLLYCLYIWIDD